MEHGLNSSGSTGTAVVKVTVKSVALIFFFSKVLEVNDTILQSCYRGER